jgi:hypothetical protein
MRQFFICCACLLCLSVSAQAQTVITQQQGQQYYQNCVKQPNQTMDGRTQHEFCTCTANFMMQNLTMEDLRAMNGQDQAARNALNKMVIGVYAPCMQFPIKDLIQKKCMTDVKKQNVCQCLSNNMAAFTASEAQRLLGTVLAQNPNAFDPMSAIMDQPEFKARQQQISLQCLTQR